MCHGSSERIVMGRETALRQVTVPAPDAIAVVACGLSRHQRAYVLDGIGRRAAIEFSDSFESLGSTLGTLPRCDVFVLAADDASGRSAQGTVERLAAEWPGAAIVVFFAPRTERAVSVRSLALAGAHQFVFEGVGDTAAAVAKAVDIALREVVGATVLSQLMPLVPKELHSILDAVLSRPDELTSVEALAGALGIHRKTLVNRCARARFPAPGEVLVWFRLAMVGYALERTGATVESIALTLGFTSHTALRNCIKRYTGLRAMDIRRGGGLGVVLDALHRRIAKLRRELPIQ
jgi:AraC-like DNA-binding protein